jgi:hypothetical protein
MRAADLEPSRVLLDHLARRLTTHCHELARLTDATPSDLWALGADLAALIPVIEVLRGRLAVRTPQPRTKERRHDHGTSNQE